MRADTWNKRVLSGLFMVVDDEPRKFTVNQQRTGRPLHTLDAYQNELELVNYIQQTGHIGGLCL